MRRTFLFTVVALASGAAVEARPPIVFDTATLERHRLEGETSLVVRDGSAPWMSRVPVTVTISPTGEVTAVQSDPKWNAEGADPAPALAAARRWKFRPLRYRGEAVPARGIVNIAYRPPPRWRDPNAPLPPIDYSSLKIELVRSALFRSLSRLFRDDRR